MHAEVGFAFVLSEILVFEAVHFQTRRGCLAEVARGARRDYVEVDLDVLVLGVSAALDEFNAASSRHDCTACR